MMVILKSDRSFKDGEQTISSCRCCANKYVCPALERGAMENWWCLVAAGLSSRSKPTYQAYIRALEPC
jgi:hypothetical protein